MEKVGKALTQGSSDSNMPNYPTKWTTNSPSLPSYPTKWTRHSPSLSRCPYKVDKTFTLTARLPYKVDMPSAAQSTYKEGIPWTSCDLCFCIYPSRRSTKPAVDTHKDWEGFLDMQHLEKWSWGSERLINHSGRQPFGCSVPVQPLQQPWTPTRFVLDRNVMLH